MTGPGPGPGPRGSATHYREGRDPARTLWVFALVLTSFMSGSPCAAQGEAMGSLTVTLEPIEITVGDRVEARVTLEWAGAHPVAAPRFPAWGRGWGAAEVLAAGRVEESGVAGGRRVYLQNVTVTVFRTGEVELPPVTVAVPLDSGTVEVALEDAARLSVRSVLPEEGEGGAELEPRPAAPPVALEPGRRFPATAAVLAGLCMLAAWRLARKLATTPAVAAARPPLEPLAELLESLRRLDPGAGEPAHTGLSLGLRHFLGRSLGLPAVESTTREIQRRLRRTPLAPSVAEGTVRLLRDCDAVKFARADVTAAQTEERLLAARALAREIDDSLRPKATPEATAEAAG